MSKQKYNIGDKVSIGRKRASKIFGVAKSSFKKKPQAIIMGSIRDLVGPRGSLAKKKYTIQLCQTGQKCGWIHENKLKRIK